MLSLSLFFAFGKQFLCNIHKCATVDKPLKVYKRHIKQPFDIFNGIRFTHIKELNEKKIVDICAILTEYLHLKSHQNQTYNTHTDANK